MESKYITGLLLGHALRREIWCVRESEAKHVNECAEEYRGH
jgi:hypothetical protein